MYNAYTYQDVRYMMRVADEIAEQTEHNKRRPRETKYGTTKFYNFKPKKKGRK